MKNQNSPDPIEEEITTLDDSGGVPPDPTHPSGS